MKSLKELEQNYQNLYGELSTTLENFANWLIELPDERSLELEYSKWDSSFGEEYDSHHFSGNTIAITLSYIDSYDDLDTSSTIHVPYGWVEAFYKGDKESIEEEVLQAFRAYNHMMLDNDKGVVRARAIELGLIKE